MLQLKTEDGHVLEIPDHISTHLDECCSQPAPEPHPIKNWQEAICEVYDWQFQKGDPWDVATIYRKISHSHESEWRDLANYGQDQHYIKGDSTKMVSISWLLAGRWHYDDEFYKMVVPNIPVNAKILEFGGACGMQAITFAKLGFDVTLVNKALHSDTNQFALWLAARRGATLQNFDSDEAWDARQYDVVYSLDVLEHIPPEDAAGTKPGWYKYATRLIDSLKPGGFAYLNAPLEKDSYCHPVATHPDHWTSPVDLNEWCAARGDMETLGCFTKRKIK